MVRWPWLFKHFPAILEVIFSQIFDTPTYHKLQFEHNMLWTVKHMCMFHYFKCGWIWNEFCLLDGWWMSLCSLFVPAVQTQQSPLSLLLSRCLSCLSSPTWPRPRTRCCCTWWTLFGSRRWLSRINLLLTTITVSSSYLSYLVGDNSHNLVFYKIGIIQQLMYEPSPLLPPPSPLLSRAFAILHV